MQIAQQVKLFDRNFVNNCLKSHYRCPKCQNEFTHNYQMVFGESHVKSNRPFLLPCGHNMCENCIFQNRTNLMCNVCLRPVDIPMESNQVHMQFNVRDFFDMNFFLFGEINFFCFNRRSASNNNSIHMSINNSINPNMPQIVVMQKCGECEAVPSIGYCKQCKVHFCNLCFDAVHKNSKVLKRHRLFREDKKYSGGLMPKQKMCQRHRKICDRYCKKCRIVCCGLCIRSDHATHSWSTVIEENELTKADICNLLEIIKNSRESLKKAQKDVKSTQIQLDEYATQTVQDISKFFLDFHSFLQLEERRILNEFNEMAQHGQEKVREAYCLLNDSQNQLNSIRSTVEFYQRRPPTDILLHEVISATSTQLEQIPCQVHISKERLSKNPYMFQTTRKIFKEFSKYYLYEYVDPQLSIQIGPIYGNIYRSTLEMQSSLDDTTSSNIEIQKLRNKNRNHKKKQATSNQNYLATTSPNTKCITSALSQIQAKKELSANKAFKEVTCTKSLSNTQKLSSDQEEHIMRICHVTSPEEFYVQKESTMLQVRELSSKYVNYYFTSTVPRNISEGHYYMAYYTEDKLWYRGLVEKILNEDLYKIFLIDLGMHLNLPKHRLSEMDENYLALPYSAVQCAIHDLMPTGGKCWSKEATQLLVEITRNNPVRVSIIEQIKNNNWKVDLTTTHMTEPISLRESFLYTGLAQEQPGVVNFKLQPKRLAPVARINQRLPKQTFQQGEMLTVLTTHIEDPQEFYVIKSDQSISKKQMFDQLNQFCGKNDLEQIYLGSQQMCCAVKAKDVWYRGCLEEIRNGGKIRVRLVDEGSYEVVNWNQLFVLPEKFQEHKEFAIKCGLADIEPLRENNYTWTDEAIKEFKQLCANPILKLFVIAVKNGEHKVSLHVTKKHLDINIGAMIVKYGYGLSLGEATQVAEINRTPKKRLCLPSTRFQQTLGEKDERENAADDDDAKLNCSSDTTTEKSKIKILKRTPISIRHIESPGEFYIAIKRIETGIRKFHRQIQERELLTKAVEDSSSEIKSAYDGWFVGKHCLVYGNLKNSSFEQPSTLAKHHTNENDVNNEYFRGVIVGIEMESNLHRPFSVFLRDFGSTLHSVSINQLFNIDPQLDRVTNAVQRCHLACVQPTGGVSNWSQTSTEHFKRNIMMYSNLSITYQREKRPTNLKSIPVVLWGMTTETADPLAPCISKYANINRMLVNAGLAHLVEPLDETKQMDRFMLQELQEGEITIEEWFRDFSQNKALKVIEHTPNVAQVETESVQSDLNSNFELCSNIEEQISDCIFPSTSSPIKAPVCSNWLKSKNINKTIFAAYPTYVDYDATIYLHDADDSALLKKLRAKIKKKYSQKVEPNENKINYLVGQACIALYHQDNEFYRVIVKRVLPEDEFDVYFIDYGNVERCRKSDLRPFIPMPKLPCIANKYRIMGICPKNGEASFPTKVLDIMHSLLVGNLVSVRVSHSQITQDIKNCSMRIGSDDVAEMLIAQGLVHRKTVNINKSISNKEADTKVCETLLQALNVASDTESDPDAEDENLTWGSSENDVFEKEVECNLFSKDTEENPNFGERRYADFDLEGISVPQINEVSFNEVDDEMDQCFTKYFDQLDNNEEEEFDYNILTDIKSMENSNENIHEMQFSKTPPLPSKKHMFELDEYKKIHEQQQHENIYKSKEGSQNSEPNTYDTAFAASQPITTDAPHAQSDDDVVELEQSFDSNYWQKKSRKSSVEKEMHQREKLDDDKVKMETSDFDQFLPNETSSVSSHISGIEFFKSPKLPTGMNSFFCTVASVISPTLIHIFPHLAEQEYREIELERRIKHLAKEAPPLKQFLPKYKCLACYSKDKKWYRALIRSHNPAAKTVDVLYVDYLNTETVSVKNLREYPLELSAWPLRTFKAKISGIKPNPHKREKDICVALFNVIGNRTLHARVEKQPISKANTMDQGKKKSWLEISLYESKKSETENVVYEDLIAEDFYSRV